MLTVIVSLLLLSQNMLTKSNLRKKGFIGLTYRVTIYH